MLRSNVGVCVLCRDAIDLLPNLTRKMRILASKFKSSRLTVIENDSKDDTVEEFRNWARYERAYGTVRLSIEVQHHNLLLERPPIVDAGYDDREHASHRSARYHRLSLLRNRCLFQVMKRPETDFFMVLDIDRGSGRNSSFLWSRCNENISKLGCGLREQRFGTAARSDGIAVS
jgi:hypothetical protein